MSDLMFLLTPAAVAVPAPAPPSTSTGAAPASLLEVATHNAVEGCVHESFAALMAAIREAHLERIEQRPLFSGLLELRRELAMELAQQRLHVDRNERIVVT